MQFPALYAAVRSVVEESLKSLAAGGQAAIAFPQATLELKPSGGGDHFDVDYEWSWANPRPFISRTMEKNGLAQAEEVVQKDDFLRPRLSGLALSALGGGDRSLSLTLTHWFFDEYMNRLLRRPSGSEATPTFGYRFSEAVFDSVYLELEEALAVDVRTITFFLPICGVQLPTETIWDLGDGLVFRRMTTRELTSAVSAAAVPTNLRGVGSVWPGSYRIRLADQWAITCTHDYEVRYFEDREEVSKTGLFSQLRVPDLYGPATALIEALRVCFGGSIVFTRRVAPIHMTLLDHSGSSLNDFDRPVDLPGGDSPCVVDLSELDEFHRVRRACNNLSERVARDGQGSNSERSRDEKIKVALRRLADAGRRSEARDALLDLCIAAEALLTESDNATELRFQVSLNAAVLARKLGLTASSRDVRQFIRAVYKLRSQIVHGSTLKPTVHKRLDGSMGDLAAVRSDLESFLRVILKAVLLNYKSSHGNNLLNHSVNLDEIL